jgi:hydroxypyruvate reductase 1
MASLAAGNVAGILSGYPAWNRPDILSFLEGESPQAAPSIVNARELGIALYQD